MGSWKLYMGPIVKKDIGCGSLKIQNHCRGIFFFNNHFFFGGGRFLKLESWQGGGQRPGRPSLWYGGMSVSMTQSRGGTVPGVACLWYGRQEMSRRAQCWGGSVCGTGAWQRPGERGERAPVTGCLCYHSALYTALSAWQQVHRPAMGTS